MSDEWSLLAINTLSRIGIIFNPSILVLERIKLLELLVLLSMFIGLSWILRHWNNIYVCERLLRNYRRNRAHHLCSYYRRLTYLREILLTVIAYRIFCRAPVGENSNWEVQIQNNQISRFLIPRVKNESQKSKVKNVL